MSLADSWREDRRRQIALSQNQDHALFRSLFIAFDTLATTNPKEPSAKEKHQSSA
jgi:hypothetical protein